MTEEGKYGPKMRALPNDRWRAACIAYVTSTTRKTKNSRGYSEAYVAAGYGGESEGSIRVQAHRMFHDQRMQEAIVEEGRRRLVGLIPFALDAHEEIMQNPQHKDFAAAAKSVLDRAGLHVVTEERHTVELELNKDSRARAVMLAEKLGIPIEQLVGRKVAKQLAAPAIDAEFEEAPVTRLEDLV